MSDRFKKISNNYGELFVEVFAEQGFDYKQFEESVFKNAKQLFPNLQDISILDIGIGDGETSMPFIQFGCKNLTGIDLNSEMLEVAYKKLGENIQLLQMNATKMDFQAGEFSLIITGAAIHNIPKKERISFWQELKRLSPKVFIGAEKIADPDPIKHKKFYDDEIKAIKKVYGEKYGLYEAEQEWLDHYEYDERERLDINEITTNLDKYDVEIIEEVGMYKTFIAKKKED